MTVILRAKLDAGKPCLYLKGWLRLAGGSSSGIIVQSGAVLNRIPALLTELSSL